MEEFKSTLDQIFTDLELGSVDYLDEEQCLTVIAALPNPNGYEGEMFKETFAEMEKNDDGKVSLLDFIEAVMKIGADYNMYGE